MRENSVRAGVTDGVLNIELGGPNEMNLLSIDARKKIMAVLKSHESDDRVRCVVISSLGRVFSAGADLKELVRLGKREARAYARFVPTFLGYVEGYPKPTIGLVDGLAVGGGLELLMTLDLVLATPKSSFGQTELNVGLIPGGGGSQRLPRLVGLRKAKEMIYTGEIISANEALELGLVTKVVAPDRLQEEASRIIRKLRSKNQKNLGLVKKAINEGLASGFDAGLELESRLYSSVLGGREAKTELRQFLEKRGRAPG